MFIGEYNHIVDVKGRVAIPAKFRSQLAGGAIVTRGLDHCLFVFSREEWKELAKKLVALPLSKANSRAFSRLMLAGAVDVAVDGQGRVLIPEYLRQYAGIDKQVVVTGLYSRIEIWDEEKWKQYKATSESSSEEIAEQLGEMGI